MSLRTKLLLLTVSMIFLTVLVILGAAQHFSKQTFELSNDATQRLAAGDIEHVVSGALQLAEVNATATRLQRETAVKNYLRSVADTMLARVTELYATLPPKQAWKQIHTEMLRVRIGKTGYVFGMNSLGVLTIHPKSEGKDLSGSAHIQEMCRKKEGFIRYHSVTAKRDKAVYYRYFQPLDLIIAPGVFIDEMDVLYDEVAEQKLWQTFVDHLQQVRLGQTGSVWILDSTEQGRFVLAPQGLSQEDQAAFPIADVLGAVAGAEAGKPSLHRLVLHDDQRDKPMMAALVAFPGKHWIIGASLPEAELQATSRRIASSFTALKLSMIAAAMVTVLLATLLALWLARRSLAPLQRGVGFARAVADGNLTATLEVTSRDEVGALTGALNAMVHGLRSMVQNTKQTSGGMETVSARLTEAADRLEELADTQAERSEGMASAINEIGASIREVDDSVVSLSEAAAENTASILELSASIEEVATNMQAVFQAGQEVSSAATEMASSSRQIAENSRQLGEASATTSSAIFQMDAGLQSLEQNAETMAQVSQGVLADAQDGRGAVDSTIAGMRDVRVSMERNGEVIRELAAQAVNIGKIVAVIDDVASEISLLALNAAIIAAQSGASGSAFAVVADEIKELAERTTLSTREITAVVEGVRGGIEQAADLTQGVEAKTLAGEQLADRAGALLVKVVGGVEEVHRGIERMAGAMAEQTGGSLAIKRAAETTSDMVGQIVQATAEQERASQEIQRSSVQLRELAERVLASTREQSKASGLIARNTEGMNSMIQNVSRACSEQVQSSELIERTGEDVRAGSQTSRQASQLLTESIAGLRREIATLNGQVEAFRTEAEEAAAG